MLIYDEHLLSAFGYCSERHVGMFLRGLWEESGHQCKNTDRKKEYVGEQIEEKTTGKDNSGRKFISRVVRKFRELITVVSSISPVIYLGFLKGEFHEEGVMLVSIDCQGYLTIRWLADKKGNSTRGFLSKRVSTTKIISAGHSVVKALLMQETAGVVVAAGGFAIFWVEREDSRNFVRASRVARPLSNDGIISYPCTLYQSDDMIDIDFYCDTKVMITNGDTRR